MEDTTDTEGAQPVLIPREEITDNVCPKCGGWKITGEFVETGDCTAVQKMSCDECNFRWKNIYDFAAVYLIDEDLVVELPREGAPGHECVLDAFGICYNESGDLNDECRNRRLEASYKAYKAEAGMTAEPESEPAEEQVTRVRGRGLH